MTGKNLSPAPAPKFIPGLRAPLCFSCSGTGGAHRNGKFYNCTDCAGSGYASVAR